MNILYQKAIPTAGSFDTVVCGGGFSGFAAAYSAAREGDTVLLIERNACLGGVGTAGLVNHILGLRRRVDGELVDNVAGIFKELERRLLEAGKGIDAATVDPQRNPHGWRPALSAGLIFDNEAMKVTLEAMLTEVGVTVLYYTDVVDIIGEADTINSVVIYNKNGLQAIHANCFIDATGDGDICVHAGCTFDFGDENGGVAAASLEMHVDSVDKDALSDYMFTTGDHRFRSIITELRAKGIWNFPYDIFISVNLCEEDVFFINTIRQVGIDGTDAASLTKGMIDGRAECFVLFDIMRAHFPGFASARLRQIAPVIGIRETRRIRCDYILSVQDLIDGTVFPDSIAVSSYGWDLPDPNKPSLQPKHGTKRQSPYTHIPYRSLLPIGKSNLLVVGRCIGCERDALGPIRVMGPCLAMGEAAGIAAHLAQKTKNFRQVDVSELKKTIESHGGITQMEM